MRFFKNLPAIVLIVMLAVCLFAYYSTRESAMPTAANKILAAEQPLVDTSLLQSVLRLAPLAAAQDEQNQAREAWRLVDHELDLTYAVAMREAEVEAALPVAGPLRQLSGRITELKARVEADKKLVEQLSKNDNEASDRAQAQLDLDQDELDDLQQQFAREGGDKRASLQLLLQAHEASDKLADQAIKFSNQGATGTLSEQLREWTSLGEYYTKLQTAAQQAAAHCQTLLEQHNMRERQLPSRPETTASVTRLRQMSEQRKTLVIFDQRIQDTKQLVAVYQRWCALVDSQRRAVLHLLFRSIAAVVAILLAAVLLSLALHSFLHFALRQADERRLHQLLAIARITLQVVAVMLILLIVFGPPSQLSTAIGLVTAGLAVVMKDFIVAFFGWFTLMGKRGISVGDWVEIEGVSGEVIEIGLLKTVLLELGNWTDSSHPTGRRVSFSNSFAMEHHYFNYSTADQWLWDEIHVTLPQGSDPYLKANEIREIVERETQTDAAEAARDWQRVAAQYRTREVSAMPAINLRPGVNGLEVVVRYITRAPQRNAVKSKLFHAIVDLLRRHESDSK